MSTFQKVGEKMTNFRWIICGLLFFATSVNYLDRQVILNVARNQPVFRFFATFGMFF